MFATRKLESRRGRLAIGAIVVGAAITLAGCSSSSDTLSGSSSSAPSGSASSAAGDTSITVGSANFPENEILADIYGQALEANGYTVKYSLNIGARAAYIPALEKGEVNLIPEYSGSILSFLDDKASASSSSDVKAALDDALPDGLTALEPSTAADSDSLNVTADFAAKNKLTSIADLAKVKDFTIAANPEFAKRPDGIKGLESVYGLKDLKFKAINDGGGPATIKALLGDQVQVADVYTTSPAIAENKLVTLTDPKNLFASQEVIPIVSSSKVTDKLSNVLNKVSAALTTEDLAALVAENAGASKTDPAVAAKDWLTKANIQY